MLTQGEAAGDAEARADECKLAARNQSCLEVFFLALLIHNTMTGRRELFEAHNGGKVSVYLCGPNMNSYCHLGQAKTYVFFDLMIRYLEYKGHRVEYVTNLTDFDDKMIARAKQSNENPLAISRRFEQAFFEDIKALRLRSADVYPRASDHVQEMIDMIRGLMQKGFTYEVDGVVYFDAKKFGDFGRLLHRRRIARLFRRLLSVSLSNFLKILHSICPAAVHAIRDPFLIGRLPAFLRCIASDTANNTYVRLALRYPYDFFLWKSVNEDELGWESPWGRGRPSWHIECSVMSRKYLGPQLDIHGGGEDLKFPHHESEIALSESYTGKKPFSNYWIHTGHLTLKGRKMSTSAGNVITVRDFLQKHTAESLRLFILSTHHRQRVNFTEGRLIQCEEMIKKIYETRDALNDLIRDHGDRQPKLQDEESRLEEIISATRNKFFMAMNNDFNSAAALASFYELINLGSEIPNMKTSKNLVETALNAINELGDILGLFQQKNPLVPSEVHLPSPVQVQFEPILESARM